MPSRVTKRFGVVLRPVPTLAPATALRSPVAIEPPNDVAPPILVPAPAASPLLELLLAEVPPSPAERTLGEVSPHPSAHRAQTNPIDCDLRQLCLGIVDRAVREERKELSAGKAMPTGVPLYYGACRLAINPVTWIDTHLHKH